MVELSLQCGRGDFGIDHTHEHYRALGGNEAERRLAYRALFKTDLDPEVVSDIRAATNGNFVLGSQRFQDQVAAMLGRRMTRGKAGRPPKDRLFRGPLWNSLVAPGVVTNGAAPQSF